MRDVTLSASSRYYELVKRVAVELEDFGLSVHTPNMKFFQPGKSVSNAEKRRLTTNFFDKIEDSHSLLIATDDKGYVGNSVSLEVGFAHALSKVIYRTTELTDPAINCLAHRIERLARLAEHVRKDHEKTHFSER